MSQMPRKSKTPHLVRRRETVHTLSSSVIQSTVSD